MDFSLKRANKEMHRAQIAYLQAANRSEDVKKHRKSLPSAEAEDAYRKLVLELKADSRMRIAISNMFSVRKQRLYRGLKKAGQPLQDNPAMAKLHDLHITCLQAISWGFEKQVACARNFDDLCALLAKLRPQVDQRINEMYAHARASLDRALRLSSPPSSISPESADQPKQFLKYIEKTDPPTPELKQSPVDRVKSGTETPQIKPTGRIRSGIRVILKWIRWS